MGRSEMAKARVSGSDNRAIVMIYRTEKKIRGQLRKSHGNVTQYQEIYPTCLQRKEKGLTQENYLKN